MESYKSACNDSFRNGTTRIDLVFRFCRRTSPTDSGWIAGTGLRTFEYITHLQDKPLVTFYGSEGLFLLSLAQAIFLSLLTISCITNSGGLTN